MTGAAQQVAADQQLLELKSKMGMLGAGSGGPAKQLGKGAGEAVEAELVDDEEEKK